MDLIKKYKDKFALLFELYQSYNGHTNISAIRDEQEVYQKHFADSLQAYDFIVRSQEAGPLDLKILDIGSGGGFPVLPLAIVLADCRFTALDSVRKKTKFISLAKAELSLDNLEIVTARAEELAHDEGFRAGFDLVTARACAELRVLAELAVGFLKTQSRLIAYKKLAIDQELEQARQAFDNLGLVLSSSNIYAEDRQLLILQKTKDTPSKFPRKYKQITALL